MKTPIVKAIAVLAFVAALSPGLNAQTPQPPGANPRRQMLEQQLRERTGQMVQRRLQLTDAQMQKLQATNRQFEQQRTALLSRERDTRRALREEILAGDKANQQKVAQLLDQTMLMERQRLELMQNEQRELAKFLTPVQRAKLFGVQNELRRRAQEMRGGRMPGRNPPPRGPRRFAP